MATISNNGSVVDIVNNIGLNKAVDLLASKCPTKAEKKVIYLQVDRMTKKHSKLSKDKHRTKGARDLEAFRSKDYTYPIPKPSPACAPSTSDGNAPFAMKHDNPLEIAQTYKDVAEQLSMELKQTSEVIEKTKEMVAENIDLNKSLEEASNTLEDKKRDLKRSASRENYWREKCQKLEDNQVGHDIIVNDESDLLREENLGLREEISNLHETIEGLRNEIDMLHDLNNEHVALYDEERKEFIPDLHKCVYSLLNNHVSTEHVSDVIGHVLLLVNKVPNRLPSKSTIKNWSLERGYIARKHISETAQNENTTLHSDEASKYGQKWGSFASRDSDGNYLLLGMRDMATKSSKDTLDTFKEIISDIDNASSNEKAGKEILINIKNTMSDKAGTEKKFNELLKEYREELLPQVMDNYERMNEESKQAISHMNNFFCGLHSLVHMAETSEKTLFQVETAHFDGEIPIDSRSFGRNGQAGTIRLIYTACKAFARRGDQKNGCHGNFTTFVKSFLTENGYLSLPLQPLRGNRFNILFVNAGHVFFFRDKMIEYLSSTPSLNGLLQSVLKDLQQEFFIAGLKALGLISKLITTPLWHVIEDKNITISEMAYRYCTLKYFVDNGIENIPEILTGEAVLFPDVQVKKDKVFWKLVEPDETLDDHVTTILSVLLPALSKLVQHQFGDHLPGGIHEHVHEEDTKSTDKHNKFPERVFAYVDYLLAQKPNISSLALESQITFSLNKTDRWLESKSQQEVEEIIKESRKEVRKERERFKNREQSIREKRLENQRIQFETKARQEQKRIEKMEKETQAMQYYGLWQSVDQIQTELNMIDSNKQKEEALKTQLRFRKSVFQQKADTGVYAFSKVVDGKRVNLSVNELQENVSKLVSGAFQIDTSNRQDGGSLLVGKRVKQKFLNEAGNEFWSTGKVISQVPGFPKWFNIVYDNDEAVYSDNLADHYAANDLEILC